MTSIDLYERAIALTGEAKPFVLAAVIDSLGSTPQKAGANAIIEPTGRIWGTLGGGCLEAESRQRALRSLDEGKPDVFDLKLDEVTGWDDGLICGGRVRILVNPNAEANAAVYREALRAKSRRDPGLLITVVSHPGLARGTAFWTLESGIERASQLYAADEEEVRHRMRMEEPGTLSVKPSESGELTELYLEPIVPPPRLMVAGGGHIGQAVCRLGNSLGFEVTVIDDRPAFANRQCHPQAKETICGDIAEALAGAEIDPNTYIIIVTRGHRHDGAVLAACIHSPARYIGMIGSRRKSLLIRKGLVQEGRATRQEMERVVSPMGLDIGAQSVEEIALSIAAQLVAVRRNAKLDAASKNYLPASLKP